MKKIFFYGALSLFAFSSCQKIKDCYCNTDTGGTTDSTEKKVRKVLIEEFTGHKCGNCPPGAQTIQTLQKTYGEKLIAISIHSGFYATTTAPTYTANYTSQAGDDYTAFFGVVSNPKGMVNRKDYPTNAHLKDIGQWQPLVAGTLALPPDAYIKISNNYNPVTRALNATVRTEFLTDMTGTYKIVLLLTEDSIVSPQKDYSQTPSDILNYTHRHMLRGAISSTSWGDVLASGLINVGDTVIKQYTYNLPTAFNNTTPNPDRCKVVAYIYDAATYEVIQAEEEPLK